MPVVHIVSRKNGVGLDRDVEILTNLFEPRFTVRQHGRNSMQGLKGIWRPRWQLPPSSQPTLNLMVERVPAMWCRAAGFRLLVPNQERYPKRHLGRLRHLDLVLCKTRQAVDVFSKYTDRVAYVGFTSRDRRAPHVEPDYTRFFHLAGRNTLKGTETLIDIWREHPEWPVLTIVQNPLNCHGQVPANVNRIERHMSDAELQKLQNQCGIHLCPSRSEGWGHSIVEAMSCGAVVVTTDGPPMNELISTERGILVPWQSSTPRHLGTCYNVDPQRLESVIIDLIAMPPPQKRSIGQLARQWYVANDEQFKRQFLEVVETHLLDAQQRIRAVWAPLKTVA